MNAYANLLGRILLAAIFIYAGISKVLNPEGTGQYLASTGLPAQLVWPTIVFEFAAALAIIVGFQARIVAWALAAFCIVSGLLFHNPADPAQMIMFLKNLAMAGGLLLLASGPTPPLSLDARRKA